ncbi:MAG: UDP-2,4-diacetamido-2,4,6-trideoxy-beta-L-altropyranose hydrolase, partial [Alphaproteobacteria bacterium]|nr:UDP-2,4-diacetamido-2,4,6-trideoxy-beta-L-altropyranose hydrolase [Alphaproteobacteria bacterium]
MKKNKKAFFRFEASSSIGAGHAMRSCVIADALVERGWECCVVTTETTYELIKSLERFKRIDPNQFYDHPINCDLLVVDNYDLDQTYEQHFRLFAKKILVIDDLANRPHECDVLIDQTYGRAADDYKSLVSESCTILAGSDYALIRNEFAELRPKALEKRRNTTEIKRALISMGGGDVVNWMIEALKMLQDVDFQDEIDIVIGFSVKNKSALEQFIETLPNKVTIHVNGNMPELNYNADFAIGAAGSSVWERACLGLPQFLIMTAANQKEIVKLFSDVSFSELYMSLQSNYQNYENSISAHTDGLGCLRIINYIEEKHDK